MLNKNILLNMIGRQTGNPELVNILRSKDKQGLKQYVMNTCLNQNKDFAQMYQEAKIYAKNNLGL